MNELARARYLNLATFRRDGRAVETPVWFAESDGRLYAFSEGRAGKVKRLRNSPRSRVAACDVRGRLRGPWQDASARVVSDSATVERAYASLRAKYGLQMRLADALSRLSGRYAKRAMLEIIPAQVSSPD
jgi:PPOX class probable F420-dependent enzyme